MYYLLVIYRSTDGGAPYSVTAAMHPRSTDDSAVLFVEQVPDTTISYKSGLTACRDIGRSDCGAEAESSVFAASTVVNVTISDLTPGSIVAGQRATFAVRATNLSPEQTYRLQVHTDSGGVLKYDGCASGSDPLELGIYDNVAAVNRSGIVVFACESVTENHSVFATVSVGNYEIARSDGGATDVAVTPVPMPVPIRIYGNGGSEGSAVVRWESVSNAIRYEIQFDEYSPSTDEWTDGQQMAIASPLSRVISVGGGTREFLEKTFGNLAEHHFYGVKMRVVSGVRGQSEVASDWTERHHTFVQVGATLPDDDPPLAFARAPHEYSYAICGDTLASMSKGWTAAAWSSDIINGLDTWESNVLWTLSDGRNIVSAQLSSSPGDCRGDRERLNSVVKGVPDLEQFRRTCGWDRDELTMEEEDAKACTISSPGRAWISILFWTGHSWNPGNNPISGCSDVVRLAAHEGGHVFGVDAHTGFGTLMNSDPGSDDCEPKPWDVMMVIRGFQTR